MLTKSNVKKRMYIQDIYSLKSISGDIIKGMGVMRCKIRKSALLTFLIFFVLSLSPCSVLGQGLMGTWKVQKVLKSGEEKSIEKMEIYINITKNNVNRIFYYTEKDKCTKFYDDILQKKENILVVDTKDAGKTEMEIKKNKNELVIYIKSESLKLVSKKVGMVPRYVIECSR